MRSVRLVTLTVLLSLVACGEEPLTSGGLGEPPPPAEGLQAFLQVNNDRAQPGERVDVYVKVQFGAEAATKLGSYTGRLRFDREQLGLLNSVDINDGLRVVNPDQSEVGEVRFAGAAPKGFDDLTLFHGIFEGADARYMDGLKLEMEELSAAMTLTDLEPQLQIAPQIFLRRSGS